MRFHHVLLGCVLGLCALGAAAQTGSPLKSVANVDVNRYLGRWYEIAKFPNWFQKKCVSDTAADYTLLPDGQLRVLNQCRLADGDWDRALGVAKPVTEGVFSQLKVRFAPGWLSFLPFVWGDYWVVDLDEAYQLAAVSEPGRQYLWILSRTPVVDEARYAALLSRLSSMGLDVGRLEKSPQPLASRTPP